MVKKLVKTEILHALQKVPGWELVERDAPYIRKVFHFADYMVGIGFVVKVAEVAQALDHHPDILVKYGSVDVSIHTHEQSGLTDLDFAFAKKVEIL